MLGPNTASRATPPAKCWCAAIALCFAAFVATPVTAQQTPPREEFSLRDFAAMIRPGGPAWQGRAAFPPAPGAVIGIHSGAHAVGGVVAEIEIAPTRTARLMEAVTLVDPGVTEGITIPAGAALIARNGTVIESYPGRQPVVTDRGQIEWCVLETGVGAALCIDIASDHATYRSVSGPTALRGPVPNLQEEPIAFDPPLVWRLSVREIDPERGVSFRGTVHRGDEHIYERDYGFVASGRGVQMSERYPGLRFRVREDGERAIIEAR